VKLIKFTVIAVVSALIHTGAMAAPKFTITTQTFNANTNQPQTAFHPGDKVLVAVTTTFPDEEAVHKQVTLSISAKATIAGISIPYKLSNANSLPNANPAEAGAPALFQSGTETRVFTIPPQLPNASLSLQATATIKSVGTARSTAKITVTQ
jgi:hypothetical protein